MKVNNTPLPIMIDAALLSAQRRKRLFFTNIPNVTLPEDRGIFLKDILEQGIGEPVALRNRGQGKKPEYNGTGKANALTTVQTDSMVDLVMKEKSNTIRTGGRGSGMGDKHNWESVYKVAALTETRTNEAKKLRSEYMKKIGKDFSPRRAKELVARTDGKANTITTGSTKESLVMIVPEATKKGYAIAHVGDSVDMSFPTSKTRRGRVGNKAKNIMTSQSIGVFDGAGIRKLTTVECERLQSLPDNYTEGVSNTQRYKALGNAFNVDVVAHILSFIKRNHPQ
jgi:site-specific DNA-cytosine methylase